MVESKEKIVNSLKLKEYYDPNALHDLKDIVELDGIVNQLYINRNNYLENFIKSKFLSYDEMMSLVPDGKFEQMKKNGEKYIQTKDTRYGYSFSRWGNACGLSCGIAFYLLVDKDTILPVIFPVSFQISMNDVGIDYENNVMVYSITRYEQKSKYSQSNDYWYSWDLRIGFSTITNELLYCDVKENSHKSYASPAGQLLKYGKR